MTPLVMAKFLGVFFSVAAADVCWTKYMQNVALSNRAKGALWSASIVAVGSVSTLAYISSPAYIIPAALGAFVGTYLSISPKDTK